MTLKREWPALDASQNPFGETKIPAGRHEIERIPNPFNAAEKGSHWLVLKGTKVGGSEGSWRQWINDGTLVDKPGHPNNGKPIDWEEFEVVIEE